MEIPQPSTRGSSTISENTANEEFFIWKKNRIVRFLTAIIGGGESKRVREEDKKTPRWKKLVHFLFPPLMISERTDKPLCTNSTEKSQLLLKSVVTKSTISNKNSESIEKISLIEEKRESDEEIIVLKQDKEEEKSKNNEITNVNVEEKATKSKAAEYLNTIEKPIKTMQNGVGSERISKQKIDISQKLTLLESILQIIRESIDSHCEDYETLGVAMPIEVQSPLNRKIPVTTIARGQRNIATRVIKYEVKHVSNNKKRASVADDLFPEASTEKLKKSFMTLTCLQKKLNFG
jgi:hypothetical protein